MDSSLEKTIVEILKIEKERLQPTHVCYPKPNNRFVALFSAVKPVTALLLMIAAILTSLSFYYIFSASNQSQILLENSKLRGEMVIQNDNINKLEAIAMGALNAKVEVRFGNSGKAGNPSYFEYSDENSIVFNTSKPRFDEVVRENMGIYLCISTGSKMTERNKYLFLGYLREKFPTLVFVAKGSATKNIVLPKNCVEWDKAKIMGDMLMIPLELDFGKFMGLVLQNSMLELPNTRIEVD